MHLLTPLASGVAGAEDGTVDVYQRGTTTRATYYTAFDGSGATTPTGSLTLDANGAAVLYVNEICDVVVKDTGGVAVHEFTSSPSAAAVEVISRSFTGTDYNSGVSGASKPTDLQTVLDRLYTSFGALDFNVLLGGASTTVQAAFSGLATLYFNVKSSVYGATGDGVTSDTTAVQAAVDAAQAAGGGIVFFPRGTYRVTTTITVGATVSLLGVGPAGSILFGDGCNAVTMSAGLTYFTSVEGLRFSCEVKGIVASAGRLLRVENCYFDNTAGQACIDADTDGIIFCSRTVFAGPSGAAWLTSDGTSNTVFHCYGCVFVLPAAAGTATLMVAWGGSVIACKFDTSVMATGTITFVQWTATPVLTAPGCFIACTAGNPIGGTVTVTQSVNGRANDGVTMFGNRWGSAVVVSASTSDATAASYFGENNADRLAARYYVADDGAAVSAPSGQYAEAEIVRSNANIQTVTLTGPGPVNLTFTLVYNNIAVGSVTGTITMAGSVKGLTTFTVNANKWSAYTFKSIHVGTAEYWALVGSLLNQ